MKIITFTILLFSIYLTPAYSFFIDYNPSINGTVLDENSSQPISNAHIIIFTYYYPLPQIVNVGGPNEKLENITVMQADIHGKFNILSDFKLYFGFKRFRHFFFYKKGYYVDSYVQRNNSLFVRCYYPPSMANYKDLHAILLSNNRSKWLSSDFKYYVINDILERVLYGASSNRNSSKFNKLKPALKQLYDLFSTDSKDNKIFYNDPKFTESFDRTLIEIKGILATLSSGSQ